MRGEPRRCALPPAPLTYRRRRYPSVTRVRRTVSYNKPLTLGTTRRTTVERRVIW